MELQTLWQGQMQLGEGPLWHPERQALYWIDIVEPALHHLDWQTKTHQFWKMPDMIGCIALANDGNLLAALRNDIVKIDLATRQVDTLAELIVGRDDIAFNDGAVDRRGRFWVGTKDMAEQSPKGALYRYDGDASVHLMTEQLVISNGIAWSLDNTIMYHSDSGVGTIYQYDFDLETGTIANRQTFFAVPNEAGFPDGLCIDSEGCLWVAHWDGWRVTRYTPDGQIDRIIKMPVQRPTCCCFAGPELETLVITSAAINLSAEELNKGPQSGSVFALDVGVKGVAEGVYGS